MPTTLAAVLFVELADFADILSDDEQAALELLASYRKVVAPIVDEHGGETVDVTGTELLVVFSSAVAAVQCGLHLCKALLPFSASAGAVGHAGVAGRAGARVGVHLGEIWRDSGKVYGNGVNVAARVMQAAPPGAFFVSEDVYRQVSGKLDLVVREVGDAVLKNIDRPLVLYEVDAGRGFLGAVADHMECISTQPGIGLSMHTGGSPYAPLLEEPYGPAHGSSPHSPPPPHVPPHGATPTTAMLAMEFRDSITREVKDALATARVTRSKTGHGITIDIGPDASVGPVDRSVDGPGARTSSPVSAGASLSDSAEATRDKASDRIAAATKALVMSGGIAAGLGYGYVATGKWPLALGAAIVVLAPFLSSLKQLIVASSELRLIDKRARRKAGKG